MKKRMPAGPGPGGERPSRRDATAGDAVLRLVERKPFGSSATGPPPTMKVSEEVPSGNGRRTKKRGRLDRAVLAMLGKGLVECFDEVRKQEVPERFKTLLRQF